MSGGKGRTLEEDGLFVLNGFSLPLFQLSFSVVRMSALFERVNIEMTPARRADKHPVAGKACNEPIDRTPAQGVADKLNLYRMTAFAISFLHGGLHQTEQN